MKLKYFPLAALAATLPLPLLAGDEPVIFEKGPIPEPQPEPTPLEWFVGATAGYLVDYETEFYSFHIGKDMDYQLGGWDPSVYLEVAYFEQDYNLPTITFGALALGGATDLEVIPISLNYKLEKQLSGKLNAYFGAGAGVALIDVSMAAAGSDDDTTFFGQVFGGLLYNFCANFEGYAGARWIYLDEVDVLSLDSFVDTGDDVVVEGGIRINF